MAKKRKAEKPKTHARLVFKSTQLWRILEKLKDQYEKRERPKYLDIPFILTCAAYLESRLNDSLHDANQQYGEEFALALMSLSLRNKLKILVPLLTNGKYIINTDHFVYKRLTSLISIRNRLAHAKPELEELSAAPEDLIDIFVIGVGLVKTPKQFMGEPDITLGACKQFSPTQYLEALEKLQKWFFLRYPDKLNKVAMVVARSGKGGWKEELAHFSKDID